MAISSELVSRLLLAAGVVPGEVVVLGLLSLDSSVARVSVVFAHRSVSVDACLVLFAASLSEVSIPELAAVSVHAIERFFLVVVFSVVASAVSQFSSAGTLVSGAHFGQRDVPTFLFVVFCEVVDDFFGVDFEPDDDKGEEGVSQWLSVVASPDDLYFMDFPESGNRELLGEGDFKFVFDGVGVDPPHIELSLRVVLGSLFGGRGRPAPRTRPRLAARARTGP